MEVNTAICYIYQGHKVMINKINNRSYHYVENFPSIAVLTTKTTSTSKTVNIFYL